MAETDTSSEGLGRSAFVVSAGTFLSRIFGLIRDMSVAYVFGASRVTDVFFVAYQIPSLFRKLLGEGALSSSLVPVYVDVRNSQSEQQANQLASAAFTVSILGVGGLVGLGILLAPYLVSAIAPGFIGTPYFDLTVRMTRYLFPFLLMMSAASVVMGVLHGRQRYAPSAFAPVCLNLALIASVLFLAPRVGGPPEVKIKALVVGVLVGGFFQFFVQWYSLHRSGIRLRWNPDWGSPGLDRVLSMMGPMVFGLAITQLIALVDKLIASFLDPGNISHIYYANRLFQFPFALIGIALGTVVLPRSSEQVSQERTDEVVRTARHSIGMMTFLMVPAALGLALVGRPLIGLLFRGQEFTLRDQHITFGVLLFSLLGLVAYGLIRIFVSLCYSFEDTTGPVLAAGAALVVNAVFDLVFVWLWPVARYRVCGLALAGSLAVWVQVTVLRWRLRRHLPGADFLPGWTLVRHLLFSLGMVLVLIPLREWGGTPLRQVVLLVGSGASVYVLLAYWAGESYPRDLLQSLVE